jgi:hypothetical protein
MIKKLILMILAGTCVSLAAQTGGPATFNTAEEARDALVKAAGQGLDAVKTLFGPGSADVVRTGDGVEDQNTLTRFKQMAAEKMVLEPDPMNPDRVTFLIGTDEWPLAVPIVRKGGRWTYDIQEGKAEIRRRTIGGNELDTIDICRGYVEAQQMYAEKDWDGNGVLEYAKKIVSSEGQKDGLYWPGEDSPVAAGFAKAVAQGYSVHTGGAPQPYHGYYYKVLMAQGPDAQGGIQDYVVHGLMIGGFALVAWPAEYGISGIKTFIVNHDGVVYEKDLGPTTSALAKAMTRFNPDKSWQVSPDETEQ